MKVSTDRGARVGLRSSPQFGPAAPSFETTPFQNAASSGELSARRRKSAWFFGDVNFRIPFLASPNGTPRQEDLSSEEMRS